MRAVSPWIGLLAGALCAIAVACGGQKAAMAPQATGAMPVAAGPAGPGGGPREPREQIDELSRKIDADLASLGLARPPVPATACIQPPCAAEAMSAGTAPMSAEDPACKPGAGEVCRDSCRLSDSICDSAGRICRIAATRTRTRSARAARRAATRRGRSAAAAYERAEPAAMAEAAAAAEAMAVTATVTETVAMTIRPAAPGDAGGIWAVLEPVLRGGEHYALPRDMSREAALAYWHSPGHDVFVAVEGGGEGRVVGTYFVRANQQGGGAHVANAAYATARTADAASRPTIRPDPHPQVLAFTSPNVRLKIDPPSRVIPIQSTLCAAVRS